MAGNRLTKFGGMVPIEHDRNLPNQMATLAVNVDLSRHSLKPWREPKKLSGKIGNFVYKEKCCEIVSNDCHASIADTQINCGYMVSTGIKPWPAIALPDDACADSWCRLGFPCNLDAPQVTATAPASPFELNDQMQVVKSYAYRLKNKFGQYSGISLVSAEVSTDTQLPVVVALPTTFAPEYCITEVEVFVTEGNADRSGVRGNSDLFYIGAVPVGTATFTDTFVPLGDMLDTDDVTPPPDDLRDVRYWRAGQLAGLSGDLVVFSRKNHYHDWPDSYTHALHDKPITLVMGSGIGFVATDGRPAIIRVTANCDAGACYSVADGLTPDPHPIVSKRSIALHNDHAIWATKDGLLMVSPSGQTRLLTADYYAIDQWRALKPETMIGAVHDGIYYGFTDEIGIRFDLPDSTYKNTNDTVLTTLQFTEGKPTAMYRSFQDELYIQFADGLYQWNEGSEFMTLKWHGVLRDMPGYTSMTAYKVRHEFADVLTRHWLDDELIDTELVQHSRGHRLPIASGIEWQVEFETKGEILEYHIATSHRDLSEGQ